MMPERIARLPRDKRGFPIPWNVLQDNGVPFFTVNDSEKHNLALRSRLCPICGDCLGRWKWFAGGPLSAFHEAGGYFDLPGHADCMRYALSTCPYLALPQYLGRIDVPNKSKLPKDISVLLDPTQIPERPDVFVAVASDHYELERGAVQPVLRPLRPYMDYECWRHGKVVEIEDVLPLLRKALGPDWNPPEKRML